VQNNNDSSSPSDDPEKRGDPGAPCPSPEPHGPSPGPHGRTTGSHVPSGKPHGPSAGPHAMPELPNNEKSPGTGTLRDATDANVPPAS
jgi:hypothetical protein